MMKRALSALAALFVLAAQTAWATDTGWVTAGTGANEVFSVVAGSSTVSTAWSNPTRVTANDGSYALSDADDKASDLLKATNFGFSIPAGARIDGVEMQFYRRTESNAGNTTDYEIGLIVAGDPILGDNKAAVGNWPTTGTMSSTYGGSTDTWGYPLTVDDVNSSNFGVFISDKASTSTNKQSEVDYVQLKVYYTASAGPTYSTKSPGTVANDATTGSMAWATLTNVGSSDGNRATASVDNSGDISQYLKCTNYGFAIDSGATIDGIMVIIESRVTNSGATPDGFDNRVRLVKGGTIGSTDKAKATRWAESTTATIDQARIYGGKTDLWGDTWTPSDINASNFGAVLSAKTDSTSNLTAGVDDMKIVVFYTAAAGGGPTSSTGFRSMRGNGK